MNIKKSMNESLLKEIVNCYPEYVLAPFDSIMEQIGFEGLCTFIDEFGGSSLYVPCRKTVFGGCIGERIKEEYNGVNIRKLCQRYGFCERTIRTMLER